MSQPVDACILMALPRTSATVQAIAASFFFPSVFASLSACCQAVNLFEVQCIVCPMDPYSVAERTYMKSWVLSL
jgi:hypothetical protein